MRSCLFYAIYQQCKSVQSFVYRDLDESIQSHIYLIGINTIARSSTELDKFGRIFELNLSGVSTIVTLAFGKRLKL